MQPLNMLFMLQVPGLDPNTGLTSDDAVRSLARVANAYTPTNTEFKFQHLFLSVIDNPAQKVKPPHVDETRWRQALAQAGGPNNPDRYESEDYTCPSLTRDTNKDTIVHSCMCAQPGAYTWHRPISGGSVAPELSRSCTHTSMNNSRAMSCSYITVVVIWAQVVARCSQRVQGPAVALTTPGKHLITPMGSSST